jgi:hypothetical protein
MANSHLMGREFGVPPELQKFTGSATISYSMLKKLKNFFDYTDNTHPSYQSKGGDQMKQFIDASLGSQRDRVVRSSELKSEFGTENGFKQTHTKNNQTSNLGSVGGVPKVHKTNSKRIYKGETLYESQIKRIIQLMEHKSIL